MPDGILEPTSLTREAWLELSIEKLPHCPEHGEMEIAS